MTIAKIHKRVAAASIDLVIVIILSYCVIFFFNSNYPYDEYDAFTQESFYKTRGFLIGVLVDFFYTVYLMQSGMQATFGMLSMGIKISKTNEEKINFGTACLRYFVSVVSSIFLKLGFLYALLNEKKQTVHDQVANTIVIEDESSHESKNSTSRFEPLSKTNEFEQINIKDSANFSPPVAKKSPLENDENLWEMALVEFESENRKKGLYAKLFSLNNGNEQLIKSEYIKERFQQLKLEQEAHETEMLKAQNEYEKNKRAEESLLGGAFEVKIKNGLECFYFANNQAAIKVSDKKYRLYESESALEKSLAYHKSNGMFLTTGLIRTIELQ